MQIYVPKAKDNKMSTKGNLKDDKSAVKQDLDTEGAGLQVLDRNYDKYLSWVVYAKI